MSKRYRKKPIEIDAVQWTGYNLAELRKMEGFNAVHTCFCGELNIKTVEGLMHASIGDYIIKGVQGEFYPCKPDIFGQTYEEAKDGKTEEQQAVEPEQKKGKWKRKIVDGGFNADWHCSRCGWKTSLEEHGYNFCPHCGARMER